MANQIRLKRGSGSDPSASDLIAVLSKFVRLVMSAIQKKNAVLFSEISLTTSIFSPMFNATLLLQLVYTFQYIYLRRQLSIFIHLRSLIVVLLKQLHKAYVNEA